MFVMLADGSRDIIADFDRRRDRIDLSETPVASFADLTFLDLTGGMIEVVWGALSFRLAGMSPADPLTAEQFLFG